tara:strand:- start:472 stop:843 length:372 start_codon:yes stop_codon:yes gene_type:complete
MSDYNWCHNPSCHTIETQSRIRGSGDNKVLRTRKIKVGRYNYANDNTPDIWDYFCNQQCLFQFLNKFCVEIANTYSVKQPSETPIKVNKWKEESYRYQYIGNGQSNRVPYMSTRTEIKSIDND